MFKDFFCFLFSVSSFVSVVEEMEGVDGEDIGLESVLFLGIFYKWDFFIYSMWLEDSVSIISGGSFLGFF